MSRRFRTFAVVVLAVFSAALLTPPVSAASGDLRISVHAYGTPLTDGTFMFGTMRGLEATFDDDDGPINGGEAVFFIDGAWNGNAAVVDGVASRSWYQPAVGTHTVTVHYNDADGIPVANSGPVEVTVERMQTGLSLIKQSYDQPAGTPMSVSAVLTYAQGIPELKEQGVDASVTEFPTGTLTLNVAGRSYTATTEYGWFRIDPLSGGSHPATLTYSGDGNYEPSVWNGTIDMGKNRTQLPGDFSCSPGPGGSSQLAQCLPKIERNRSLEFYVDPVEGIPSGSLPVKPTGAVTVSNKGRELARADLADGKLVVVVPASRWSPYVADGPQQFIIRYEGDASFEPTSAVRSYWVVADNRPAQQAPGSSDGYRLLKNNAGTLNYGLPAIAGSEGLRLSAPAVGGVSTVTRQGYWAVASDGGVFSFGDARFFGSMGGKPLNKPVVSMAATPSGNGYWLVASDGGVFSYGDAGFYGSTGSMPLNKPVVGMTATPSGKGYWLVASDGGIFAFGDARFYGSAGSLRLNKPVVAMTANGQGDGYRLVASDGGVFSFGNAPFYGSTGANPIDRPILGMSQTRSGNGYWITADDGRVFAFGDAWSASSANNPVASPGTIVGLLG